MKRQMRPLKALPLWVVAAVLGFASLQVVYNQRIQQDLAGEFQQLEKPLDATIYQATAMGSDLLLSYLLLLDLQLHDNQHGSHVAYSRLDYSLLDEWLSTLYQMNPDSGYAAFLASRVYAATPDSDQLRKMVDLIERLFQANPELHWRRMTEASLLAKHRLVDLPRALQLAQQVAALPKSIALPYWARSMQVVLLDELNELESAQLLISSMLQDGQIDDPDEIRFLRNRLLKIQQSMSASEQ